MGGLVFLAEHSLPNVTFFFRTLLDEVCPKSTLTLDLVKFMKLAEIIFTLADEKRLL